jgi:hypothetical protein
VYSSSVSFPFPPLSWEEYGLPLRFLVTVPSSLSLSGSFMELEHVGAKAFHRV